MPSDHSTRNRHPHPPPHQCPQLLTPRSLSFTDWFLTHGSTLPFYEHLVIPGNLSLYEDSLPLPSLCRLLISSLPENLFPPHFGHLLPVPCPKMHLFPAHVLFFCSCLQTTQKLSLHDVSISALPNLSILALFCILSGFYPHQSTETNITKVASDLHLAKTWWIILSSILFHLSGAFYLIHHVLPS